MLIRDSGIRQNDIAEEISGVDGLVDRLISPALVVPPYQELLPVEYLMSCTGYPKLRSVRDVL